MSPTGGGEPTGDVAAAINDRFGDLEAFKAAFKNAAMGQFGSGWAWLVCSDDGVDIVTTGNADMPLVHGATPLLTLDVWEHAYYLDYQNKRDAYVDSFLNDLVNWEFAAQNFAAS
jgi:Fe-Mn family superoxide dismutase